MALTKVEAAKLTNDMVLRGVLDTIVKESAVLALLPFIEVNGTALTWNMENATGSVAFYDVGDTWAESTPTFTQKTAALKILGGDADIDNFLEQTYADPNDLATEVLIKRAKAVAYTFSDTFWNGDTSSNAKAFDGITKTIAGNATQEFFAGANGANLTLDMMDQLIDTIVPGRPDALFMARRTRRKLSSLRRNSGNLLETGVDQFGQHATFYDGIPIYIDDNLPTTEVRGTSGSVCSSIYAIRFGENGVTGFENGGVQIDDLGPLETKDADRWRIKWYAAAGVKNALGVGRLAGILP